MKIIKRSSTLILSIILALSIFVFAACGSSSAFTDFGDSSGATSSVSSGSKNSSADASDSSPTDSSATISAGITPALEKEESDIQFQYEGNMGSEVEVVIDGIADDDAWAGDALVTLGNENNVSMKMYRGSSSLYFFFDVVDTNLYTLGGSSDNVSYGDSVELYFDTELDRASAPQTDDFQLNFGIDGYSRILQGAGSGWADWNGLLDYEVVINGSLNSDGATDVGYTVELMIPYSQLNITQYDTFGFSMGHVDKWNSDGNVNGENWDWYNWTYDGQFADPQVPSTYIYCTGDNELYVELPSVDASIGGTVKDTNGDVVSGVTVSTSDGTVLDTTDEYGYFETEKMSSDSAMTLTFAKEGYFDTDIEYTRDELRSVNGGTYAKNVTIMAVADASTTTLQGTVQNVFGTNLSGATVSVVGTDDTTTTGADGSFTFSDLAMSITVKLEISMTGYESATYSYDSSDFNAGTTTTLDNLYLAYEYDKYVTVAGSRGINAFDLYSTRQKDGISFKAITTSSFDSSTQLELFLYTGATSSGVSTNARGLQIKGNGTVNQDTRFTTLTDAQLETIEYTLTQNSDPTTGATLMVYVPYTLLSSTMTASDVIGLSAGVYSGTLDDWDGLTFDSIFADPVLSTTYMRIDAYNNIYSGTDNTEKVTLSGYIYDDGVGISGASVTYEGTTVQTNSSGYYTMMIVKPSADSNISVSCDGYTSETLLVSVGDYATQKNNQTFNVTMSDYTITIGGTVTDSDGGAVIANANVTINDGTTDYKTTTNASGVFSIEGIPTKNGVTITIESDLYVSYSKSYKASELASGTFTALEITMDLSNTEVTISGTISNSLGVMSGATVYIDNGTDQQTLTTNASGEYTTTILLTPSITISVSKTGYIEVAKNLSSGDFTNKATTADFELLVNYSLKENVSTEIKTDVITFNAQITRSSTGIYFVFTSDDEFIADNKEQIELYIYAGSSGSTDDVFVIAPTDNAGGVSVTVGSDASYVTTTGVALTVVSNNITDGCELLLYIPYATLSMDADDVFGFYMGVWSNSIGDWCPMQLGNSSISKDPGISVWLRVDAYNNIYQATSNIEMVTISGIIRDDSENGISGASVTYNGVTVTTDDLGGYYLVVEKSSTASNLVVSKDGYTEEFTQIVNDDFTFNYYTVNFTMSEKLITFSGTISDESGALDGVSVYIDGELKATTGADGTFSITELATKSDIVVKLELDGYTTLEYTYTSNILSNETFTGRTYTMTASNVTVAISGSIENVVGNVAGATVSVLGLTNEAVTTDENGEFEISGLPKSNMTLVVEKDGYISTQYAVSVDDLTSTASTNELGSYDLMLEYASLGSFGTSGTSGGFNTTVTRSLTAFEFVFVSLGTGGFGTTEFIEFFVSTNGTNSGGRGVTDYLFMLYGDGELGIVNWESGGNETPTSDMKMTLSTADTGISTITFTLPYAFFGQINTSYAVDPTEVIGVSFGYSYSGGWDGWGYDTGTSTTLGDYVEPAISADYIRISKENIIYWNSTNDSVDLTGYDIRVGHTYTNTVDDYSGDNFYGKISRDTTGITLDFVGFGTFETTEFVFIYLDFGSSGSTGWETTANEDYQFKIYGDGTVYYSTTNSVWWATDRTTGTGTSSLSSIIITSDATSAMVSFSVTIPYSAVGNISATSEFGFGATQARGGGADYTAYGTDGYVGTTWFDCAVQTAYPRVDEYGNLSF